MSAVPPFAAAAVFMTSTSSRLSHDKASDTSLDVVGGIGRVEDPALTSPYGGALVFNQTSEAMYEYACHEGNYALHGVLAGARADEAAKAGN